MSPVNLTRGDSGIATVTIDRQKQLNALDDATIGICLLYTSPSPRDKRQSRMPSSA